MDKVKKRYILFSLASIGFICLAVIINVMASLNYLNHNYMDGESLTYYSKIASLHSKEFELSEIFDFEWDRAFVQDNANEEAEDLNAKLGFAANLPELDVWVGYPQRVVFILDSKVVFQFKYDLGYITFAESVDEPFSVDNRGSPLRMAHEVSYGFT